MLAAVQAEAPFASSGIKGRVRAVIDIADLTQTTQQIEARLSKRKSESTINALFVGGLIILGSIGGQAAVGMRR